MRKRIKSIRIIISGGGTGGHVFPAIAIANAIKKRDPDADILFIGAKGKMEMHKVPAAGFEIRGLPISGFHRKLTLRNLSFPFKLLYSMFESANIIREFEPDAVIGVGGYASGPALQSATRKKIPTLIQEQNSYPGVTNKILAPKADKICVAYEGMERFFPAEKIILTGNPVRQDLQDLQNKKEEAIRYFSLKNDKTTLLVFGGSLGARTINTSIVSCLKNKLTNANIQVIWQTGKGYYYDNSIDPSFSENPDVRIFPFIDRMDLAYACADIIISRAGAITISELCIVGKPSILIPSPNVAEDHQTKNAETLFQKNAAIILKNSEAPEKLEEAILSLSRNKDLQKTLSDNIKKLAVTNAADRIVSELYELINNKKKKA
ncbi:MAG: undecaprenyldiphospho-muramoylpentapeptide beta-N-acetylglucosaminyltransferase [Bacteroidota bacterium]